MQTVCNFCFIYGCRQGEGIRADSKFVKDIIDLFRDNSDIKENYVDIPMVYNQVKPTDCNLELATSNLAQQLRMQSTYDIVGSKVLLYAFDSEKNQTMAGTRKLFTEFVKEHLGFSDEQIIMIDQKELVNYEEDLQPSEYYEKLSSTTWKRLTAMATSIFDNFKNNGYANQLLTIGVTECETETSGINFLFRMIQNFELNIYISSQATEQNTQTYLKEL